MKKLFLLSTTIVALAASQMALANPITTHGFKSFKVGDSPSKAADQSVPNYLILIHNGLPNLGINVSSYSPFEGNGSWSYSSNSSYFVSAPDSIGSSMVTITDQNGVLIYTGPLYNASCITIVATPNGYNSTISPNCIPVQPD